ncbi:MAG: fatty acid desaturase [Pseudomonadota bacterium]
MTGITDLSELSEKELFRLEREIANQHVGKFPHLAVIWSLTNFVVWVSLFPLVMFGYVPLWLGFILATFNITLSYLPSHEAQHDIIARPGDRLRWLNELVGWIGSIPLLIIYPVLKATHLEHHKHANNPELDPDYYLHAETPLKAVWSHIQSRQPRGPNTQADRYASTLSRIGREDLMVPQIGLTLAYFGFLFTMAWCGFALEVALLWWLPQQIAVSYIVFFLGWAPHHPGGTTERYRTTRSWRSNLGNLGSMGMQFHIVHHLHPRIPLYRTPQAYWQMKPILEARGCDVDKL